MSINRNNYEEYFLLYIDNELSAADKNMVETFVAANTDLQEELLMLQQSIAKPDAVAFTGKEKLLKAETIDAATQEKLLLLLDDELKGKEKQQIQALIQKDKTVQQEWELLQQTKLPAAAAIIFEHKALLYKKEDSKVVPIRWWRMAAAAILIGVGLWGTVSYFNNGSNSTTIVETVSSNKPSAVDTIKTIMAPPVQQQIVVENNSSKKTIDATLTTETKKDVVKVNAPKQTIQKAILPKYKEDNTVAAAPDKIKIIAAPEVQHIINKPESNKNSVATVTPQTNTITPESLNESPVVAANTFASNASLTENKVYTTFDDDGEDRPKRSKVGGFFKRVKRVLERKTNIKTGSSDDIRIANISFAMH